MTDNDQQETGPRQRVAQLSDKGENDLADAIREAIGADPDESVEVALPVFNRNDGVEVDWFPEDRMDIYSLCNADEETLKDLGLRPWNEEHTHWLFPAEWYDHIPEGTFVETINGAVEEFEHGATDDDRRFGVLPYGIRTDLEDDNDE